MNKGPSFPLVAAIAILAARGCLAQPAEPPNPLRAEIVSLHKDYCVGDQDVSLLYLTLDIRLINQSNRAVLLSKKIPAWAEWTKVGASEDALRRREVILDLSGLPIVNTQDMAQFDSLDSLIRLDPNTAYTATVKTWVPVARRDGQAPQFLHPGEYWLEIGIRIWPDTIESPEDVINRFNAEGTVATLAVSPPPVRFEIDSNPPIQECEGRP